MGQFMKLILALIITIGYTFANQSVKESDINGIWAIPEEIEYNISIGEIFTQDNKAQAYAFAYAKMENGKIIDRELTNEESNAKDLRGKIFLSNLEFNGKRWVNGKIYNPNNGGIYYAEAYLSEDKNTLFLKVSIDSFGIIGITLEWYRIEDTIYKPLEYNEIAMIDELKEIEEVEDE